MQAKETKKMIHNIPIIVAMKTKINSLDDALTYLMQGLYYTEERLIQDIDSCCSNINSHAVKREIEKYKSSSQNKLLKLERIFNYLMQEPELRKNGVIDQLIDNGVQAKPMQ